MLGAQALEKDLASPVCLQRVKVGDLVHVFEGTGAGLVRGRDVGWFGKVVGVEGETFLVRNRLLNGRGPPNHVSGHHLRLQTDFGLLLVGSEERVHFRTLSKRTRERLLASSDEHNNGAVKKAERELKKVKLQKGQAKEAYNKRRHQLLEQGTRDQERNRNEYEEHLEYWQLKAEGLQDKVKTMKANPNPYPNPNHNPNPTFTGGPDWQT